MSATKRWYPVYMACTGFVCFTFYQILSMDNSVYDELSLKATQDSTQPVNGTNSQVAQETNYNELLTTERSKNCITLTSSFKGVSQEDPRLAECIRQYLIHPPSLHPYNLKYPEKVHFSQYNQSKFADKRFFHGMRDGFFLEVGALDGEHLSNTLYFERELGWRGLLIEPLPHVYQALRKKNRKAFSINAALATSTEPSEVSFLVDGEDGALSRISRPPMEKIMKLISNPKYSSLRQQQLKQDKKRIQVEALPLYSILLAVNVTVVDFFSLDIESFEVKVLKTLPWDKVKFRLMCIEINHIPEGLPHLVRYLKRKGYEYLGVRVLDAWFRWPENTHKILKD